MTQLSPLLNGLIERKKRILWVSWFGFLLSWVLYTFAAYLGTHYISRPSQLNNTLLLGAAGFAILAGVFSLLIPCAIYNETKVRKMLKEIPKIEGLAKSRDGKLQGNLLNELKSLTIDEQRVYAIFAGYTGWFVVNGAIVDLKIQGTLLTIFTNIFAASLNHGIIVLCHDRRDWMHPERFIM